MILAEEFSDLCMSFAGGDILAKDPNGDSALSMCLEYEYDWIVPAFEGTKWAQDLKEG
jgi:hypothetical protein